jgi:hypothetical protein
MAIILIGAGDLAALEKTLAAHGGNPAGKYPCDMSPAGGRPRQEGDPVGYYPSEGHRIAGEVYSLRRKLADNAALIERARTRDPDHWDHLVLAAFGRGEACYPPTFEYGMGAGNYCTDLVSDGETLYRTRSVPGREYGQRLEAIARVA